MKATIRLTTEEERRLDKANSLGILVDVEDIWLLSSYTWSLQSSGYVRTCLPNKVWAYLHHCIIGVPLLQRDEVDHDNRNKLDNRRKNIKVVPLGYNRCNIDRSKHRYITYRPERDTYVVQVKLFGRKTYRVCYSMKEAMEVRNELLRQTNIEFEAARAQFHEGYDSANY